MTVEAERRQGEGGERERLRLIEQAMSKLAALREPDFALLAKLDRLRQDAKRALRPH